jgi:integrase
VLPVERTVRQLAEEYLAYKEQRGKRSLKEDTRILATRILPAFGSETPLRKLSAAAIAQYERKRAGEVSAFTVANELTVLRHMLRLGKRWGYVDQLPDIELPKRPGGRLRYLEQDEIGKLIDACRESRNPYLAAIVTLAVNTGMRKSEILGLEWERVNFSTSTITLYVTKSGKPRGVPINRAVYETLVALSPRRREGVGFCFRNAITAPGGRSALRLPWRWAGPRSRLASASTTCDTRAPRGWSCVVLASRKCRKSWATPTTR